MPKNVQTTTQLHVSHMQAKWCSKFSKPGFNSTWTQNFQMLRVDLEKSEEPEIATLDQWKSKGVQDIHLHLIWTMPKVLTVWMTTNYGKFLKRCKYQISLAASWEICRQIKKQELELDMEQCTRFKLGKEYIKAVYCHVAYLTYIQSTSCEMPGWMKPKLESGLPGEISITSDMHLTLHIWLKVKNN